MGGCGVVKRLAHPLFPDGWAVAAEHELLRGRSEFGETGDGEILMVEVGVVSDDVVSLRRKSVSCVVRCKIRLGQHLGNGLPICCQVGSRATVWRWTQERDSPS